MDTNDKQLFVILAGAIALGLISGVVLSVVMGWQEP